MAPIRVDMAQEQREALRQALNRRLDQWSEYLRCTCMPYRGGTTNAPHWDTCPWTGFLNGFLSAAEAVGVDPRSLDTFTLRPWQEE